MRTNLAATLALATILLTVTSSAQDYLVRPVPAVLARDSNTTFLVNLTAAKSRADFALGNPQLTLSPSGFVAGGGYKGPIGFATTGNFAANAWTVEMIVRIPYDSGTLDPIMLGTWTEDRKSTRLNSSHLVISYAVFCLKKKKKKTSSLLTTVTQ